MVDPRHVFKLMSYFYDGSLQKEEEYQQINDTNPKIGFIRESIISNFSTIGQLHDLIDGGTLLTIEKICNDYSRIIIRKSQEEIDKTTTDCYTSVWKKRKINSEIFETKQRNSKKIEEMEQRNPDLWNSLVCFIKDTTPSNLDVIRIHVNEMINKNPSENFCNRCKKGLEKLKNEISILDVI